MRNGHYTAGDMCDIEIYPADKAKDIGQAASCRIKGTDYVLYSNGVDVTVRNRKTREQRRLNWLFLKKPELEPVWYKVGALLIAKANGKGGWRPFSGRKESKNAHRDRKPHTIRMTTYEFLQVKKFLAELRGENEDSAEA